MINENENENYFEENKFARKVGMKILEITKIQKASF